MRRNLFLIFLSVFGQDEPVDECLDEFLPEVDFSEWNCLDRADHGNPSFPRICRLSCNQGMLQELENFLK